MKKQQNIFVALLKLLNIKYTKNFSNQYFNEHPHKYNLFGLSRMLSEYGIENTTAMVTNKKRSILEIKPPFIAHLQKDFVIVHQITSNKIFFSQNGNNNILTIDQFIEIWTGIVLVAEPSEKSIEPEYQKHKKTERLNILQKVLFLYACSSIILLISWNNLLHIKTGISLLVFINLSGAFISWLLVLKQIHVQSSYANKICSLFKQKDCNNVLESKAAKLWGIFGWSEIGLGYFTTNTLILLVYPLLISHIALINLITLPYVFWSIWYQYTKVKQWCVLCLITQVILWAIFIINCLCQYIRIPEREVQELFNLIMLGNCYIAIILGIHMLVSKLNISTENQRLRETINNIKADSTVFIALLKKQPFYQTDKCNSTIRFGNPNSPLQLTVLSNPYCSHCSVMHARIIQLLQKVNNNIGVQYILSSFDESINSTNKYLIASWMTSNKDAALHIFNKWFEKGKEKSDTFFKEFQLDIKKPEIEIELQKQEFWRKKNQIQLIPTILLNGYLLPPHYQIEDLQNFLELNIK